MTASHSFVFVFFGAMMSRTRSTRTSPPPPGIESRPASRRREGVEMNLVTRLDRTEQILVVVDAEIRMVTALHQ